jgi:AraC-like DNA-binding protein
MPSGVPGRRGGLLAELRDYVERYASQPLPIPGLNLCTAERLDGPQTMRSGRSVALVVQGAKRLALGDRIYDYGPGQFLIASIDIPVSGQYTAASASEPALVVGMPLDPAVLAALMLDAPPGVCLQSGKLPDQGLGVEDASDGLLDAFLRLLRLLDSPDDRRVLAEGVLREIHWRLLTGPLGPAVWQAASSDSALATIAGAVRWITDHYRSQFRVDRLAHDHGLSPSAFHRNFSALTGLSPIQFQKQLRLQKSRLLLMAGSTDVSTAAHSVGYTNLSQFSREYRRQFGLPPGRDAALSRELSCTPSAAAAAGVSKRLS